MDKKLDYICKGGMPTGRGLVFSVQEMAEELGVCMVTAYKMTEIPGFPVVHVGRRKLIPVDALHRWLNNCVQSGEDDRRQNPISDAGNITNFISCKNQ